jgi:hypothetical protein
MPARVPAGVASGCERNLLNQCNITKLPHRLSGLYPNPFRAGYFYMRALRQYNRENEIQKEGETG